MWTWGFVPCACSVTFGVLRVADLTGRGFSAIYKLMQWVRVSAQTAAAQLLNDLHHNKPSEDP
jgi:hypothetical protein